MAMTTEDLYTHLFCEYSYFTAAVELLLDLGVLAPGYSMATHRHVYIYNSSRLKQIHAAL